MTKEITLARIIQEITDKFKLRELEPEIFQFSEKVLPIYDIGSHLLKPSIQTKPVSITAGPAGYLFYTVPETEKWRFNAYNVIFMASGAYTVTGLYIQRVGSAHVVYYDMTAGQSVSYAVVLTFPVVLFPGDAIYVYVDSYTSTAELRLYVDLTKEEIR